MSMLMPMEILYRDDHLIAVNKPSGLLVHRSPIDRHETRFAMQLLRDQIGQRVFPLHRLDKPTSGVLLFALDQATARLMMSVFSEGAVSKQYLAVVRGYSAEADTIDYPLKEQLDKMTDALADRNKPAQAAITVYRRLATAELPQAVGRYSTARYSLLSLTPKTGRKHQLRRHMKHIFHPIVGDTTHGDGRHNRFFRDELDCQRLMLAATQLSFNHPLSGQRIDIVSPLGTVFDRVLDSMGWTGKIVLSAE